MDNVYLETFFFVSIVQTYILQLKLHALSNSLRSVYVSIVQTYILQLKLGSFFSGGVGGAVSIVQTYILQLKRSVRQKRRA